MKIDRKLEGVEKVEEKGGVSESITRGGPDRLAHRLQLPAPEISSFGDSLNGANFLFGRRDNLMR